MSNPNGPVLQSTIEEAQYMLPTSISSGNPTHETECNLFCFKSKGGSQFCCGIFLMILLIGPILAAGIYLVVDGRIAEGISILTSVLAIASIVTGALYSIKKTDENTQKSMRMMSRSFTPMSRVLVEQ
jgi:hypothetical protein